MITLIKEHLRNYAIEKNTLEGMDIITNQMTFSQASILGITPSEAHWHAKILVKMALNELDEDLS